MQRFSERLKAEMENKGIGSTKLQEILFEKGIQNITHKRISEYLREVSTPSYEKAKVLLEALGAAVTDEELRLLLENNRKFIKQGREDSNLNSSSYNKELIIHVKTRNILPNTSPVEGEMKMEERVRSVFGACGPKEKSLYVEKLIREDMMRNYKTLYDERNKTKEIPMGMLKKKKMAGGNLYKEGAALKMIPSGEEEKI